MKDKNKKNQDKPLSKENASAQYKLSSLKEESKAADKFESLAETKIQQAMEEGAFKNLSGIGKPIDLNKYYAMPEHLRLGYLILKNAGYLPEEVRLKREMELIKEKIRKCRSENSKKKLMRELAQTSQQFNFYMEYNKKYK